MSYVFARQLLLNHPQDSHRHVNFWSTYFVAHALKNILSGITAAAAAVAGRGDKTGGTYTFRKPGANLVLFMDLELELGHGCCFTSTQEHKNREDSTGEMTLVFLD